MSNREFSKVTFAFLLGALLQPAAYALGQTVRKVKDIDNLVVPAQGRSPANLVAIGDVLYFAATDDAAGTELWRAAGAGAVRLKDIAPGAASSGPADFVNVGSTVFFSASTSDVFGQARRGLWKTDGTSGGTVLVKALDDVAQLTVVGDTLFFAANDPTFPNAQGTELWKSDGTPDGTVVVKDILPGPDSSRPQWLANLGGTLFFAATGLDEASRVNRELWKSDGTEAGTVAVADIAPLGDSSNPSWLAAMGGFVYFAASTPTIGEELWRSDGTVAGTTLVRDIAQGSASSSPQHLTPANGRLYFSAWDPLGGRELWSSDGTGTETFEHDVNPGPGGSDPSEIVFFDDSVYFVAYAPDRRLFALMPPFGGPFELNGTDDPSSLAVMGDYLYFLDAGPSFTRRLSRIPRGSFPSPEVADSTSHQEGGALTAALGTLYFRASDGVVDSLWQFDGVGPSARVITATSNLASGSSFPAGGVNVQGTVFFAATQNATGRELWKTDGTEAGTLLVKDLNTLGDSSPTALVGFQNQVFFAADDGAQGRELWKSDGTEAGTLLVKDIAPGPQGSGPRELVVVGQTLFFVAQELGFDDLWKSDGTEAGTQAVVYLNSSGVSQLTRVGNALYFVGRFGLGGGHALFRTDGTQAGTVQLETFAARPEYLTAAGNLLFFTAPDTAGRRVLWLTDETTGGLTRPVSTAGEDPKDLLPVFDSLSGDSVYYSAVSNGAGRELWRASLNFGFMVADLVPGPESSNPKPWLAVDDSLYFSSGAELWQVGATGVPSPVAVFKTSPSRPLGPHLAPLAVSAGRLYFTADDGLSGLEVWQTDGPTTGSELFADIEPGPGSSNPNNIVVAGSQIFFQAQATSPVDSMPSGRELWVLDIPTLSIADVTVSEADMMAEFTVTLSAPSTRTVRVEFSTADGSANSDTASPTWDYVSFSGSLILAPGEQTATILVGINNDDLVELDETFYIDLSSAVGATIGRSRATGTIANDDSAVPTLTVPASAEEGDTVPVEVTNGPGNPTDWVGLYRAGASDLDHLDWKYLNGGRTAPAAGLTEATVSFGLFAPGPYEFRLFRSNGYERLAVAALEASPTLALLEAQPSSVFGGEQAEAVLSNGTGNSTDWIGLYRGEELLDWKYLNGSRTAPAVGLRNAAVPFIMPFTTSAYQFRFFKSNGTFPFAAADVSVLPPASGPPDVTVNTVDAVPGQAVQVTIAFGPGHVQDWVGLYPAGAPDNGFLDWKYLSGTRTPPPAGLADATVSFQMPATPGGYEFRFFHANTYTLLGSSASVTVHPTTPTLGLGTATATPGQVIPVAVSGGPGNRTDWIGLFIVGSPQTTYRDWKYLNGQRTPPAQGLSAATVSFTMPTTPGTYEFRLFLANGYTVLATSGGVTVQ